MTSEAREVDVTLLMPCLNEARTLPYCIQSAQDCLQKLKALGMTGEILVSDNGSTDASQEIAEEMGARVVHCPRRGYGSALSYGVNLAQGKYIVMGDSDASYDFRESAAMVEKLREGYELCMGSRFRGRIMPGAMPWKNRFIGNPVLTAVLNVFFRSGLSDAHCGLRAFTKEAFHKMQLRSPGMEFASEMVVKATILNLKRTEVPVTLHPDKRDRPPHLQPWRDGWRHLKFLFLYSPLWLFLAPSAVMLALSTAIFILVPLAPPDRTFAIGPFRFGDHWLILASSFFSIGFQGVLLGMITLNYRVRNRIFPASEALKQVYKWVTIENVFIVASAFLALGMVILGAVFWHWAATGFGALSRLREMVIVTTCFIVGIQTVFSGLLLSIIADVRDND